MFSRSAETFSGEDEVDEGDVTVGDETVDVLVSRIGETTFTTLLLLDDALLFPLGEKEVGALKGVLLVDFAN